MADQIEELREKVITVLRRSDVKRAAFFGSIVRGEMTDESDLDILVEFAGRKSLIWTSRASRSSWRRRSTGRWTSSPAPPSIPC
jgi:predicted nucleotidyltransferase